VTIGLTIVHLYPVEMNIYGDRGNVATLLRRLEWRGYAVDLREVRVGEPFDLRRADLVFAGGGQDRGQVAVGHDLAGRGADVLRAAADGVVMLTICGTYQLFGRGFTTIEGERIPGIGLFGAETFGSRRRMIGNVVAESTFGRLVGFENHSGRTMLDADQAPLARVVTGHGNDGDSGSEGAVRGRVYGTYLHGPVLPKNPHFTDALLLAALARRHGVTELEPLDDALEHRAADVAAGRPQ
jgi:CobQ-like glutamine amidotransferase family enzyme